MAYQFCGYCGADLQRYAASGNRFCPNCGKPIPEQLRGTAAGTAPRVAPGGQAAPVKTRPDKRQTDGKLRMKKLMAIFLIIGICVLASGLSGRIIMGKVTDKIMSTGFLTGNVSELDDASEGMIRKYALRIVTSVVKNDYSGFVNGIASVIQDVGREFGAADTPVSVIADRIGQGAGEGFAQARKELEDKAGPFAILLEFMAHYPLLFWIGGFLVLGSLITLFALRTRKWDIRRFRITVWAVLGAVWILLVAALTVFVIIQIDKAGNGPEDTTVAEPREEEYIDFGEDSAGVSEESAHNEVGEAVPEAEEAADAVVEEAVPEAEEAAYDIVGEAVSEPASEYEPVPEPEPEPIPGCVVIHCVDDQGNLICTSETWLLYSENMDPNIYLPYGYTVASGPVYVSVDTSTGTCYPSAITFYYNRIVTETMPSFPSSGASAYISASYAGRDYIKPQCGPGNDYQVFRSMDGKKHLYNPAEITRADICFTSGDWAYVGFGYSDGKWRYGFFRKDVFTPYSGWTGIPEYSLSYEQTGTVSRTTVPYNGPSSGSGKYESCELHAGDKVYACMESDGWYFCRFYNNHTNSYGYVYLWVPGSSISW